MATETEVDQELVGVPMKIGIFGGTFNPLHNGHINSMLTVGQRLGLDSIRVVPSFQSPLRERLTGASPDDRLEMLKCGITDSLLVIDDLEIKKGQVSYSIDTVNDYKKLFPQARLFLIIGSDQFYKLPLWKDYQTIVSHVDLVITSRPGVDFPRDVQDFPDGLRELVQDFDGYKATLNNGQIIYLIQLNDLPISATEIRKKIKAKDVLTDEVPSEVYEYIQAKALYESLDEKIGNYLDFTKICAHILDGKKALNVQAFDLSNLSQPSEYTVIASGTSFKHAQSLGENLVREIKIKFGVFPQAIEGVKEGKWVVLDYGSLIVHIFYQFARSEYNLEGIWKLANEIPMEFSTPPSHGFGD